MENFKDTLEAAEKDPLRTVFGWQFEYQLYQARSGSQALVEFVPLLVGLEQNMFQMNLNLFFGLRMPEGFEIHAGPTLSIFKIADFAPPGTPPELVRGTDSTIGMVFSFGMTFKMDELNMPVDLSVIKDRKRHESGGYLRVEHPAACTEDVAQLARSDAAQLAPELPLLTYRGTGAPRYFARSHWKGNS